MPTEGQSTIILGGPKKLAQAGYLYRVNYQILAIILSDMFTKSVYYWSSWACYGACTPCAHAQLIRMQTY